MAFHRSDLADLSYLLEIAQHRSFRRASLQLGLSPSTLSHAMRGLEERLGVRLLNRTSRSVTLTAAGEALLGEISEPFQDIGRALEVLNRFRDAPRGRLRLSVPTDAAQCLVAPVIPTFLERYPEVEIEISISNQMIDITEDGFDAGIRYGGTVPEDMIAQRLSKNVRWIVVGAPAYLERFGVPVHPEDLRSHRCIRFRMGDDRIYHWEFERGSERLTVNVPGALSGRVSTSITRAVARCRPHCGFSSSWFASCGRWVCSLPVPQRHNAIDARRRLERRARECSFISARSLFFLSLFVPDRAPRTHSLPSI
jgi:DNA-binding transcriptional LysR family regulator